MPISAESVNTFQEHGVVCLRGIFTDWIPTLKKGVARHLDNPSDSALTHKYDGHDGVFVEDFCCWERIPNTPILSTTRRLAKSPQN